MPAVGRERMLALVIAHAEALLGATLEAAGDEPARELIA